MLRRAFNSHAEHNFLGLCLSNKFFFGNIHDEKSSLDNYNKVSNYTFVPPALRKFGKIGEKSPDDTKTSESQSFLQQKSRANGEDIYSKKFMDNLGLTGSQGESKESTSQTETYKFIFDIPRNAKSINLSSLNCVNIENEKTFHLVPTLAHKLDYIVHNPGIYTLEQISKLQSDNGEFLRRIYQPDQIDFERIPPYKPPSTDKLLKHFAEESHLKYIMSTSTISSVMSHFFFLFSCFRNPNFDKISKSFENEAKRYMISQRKPITVFLTRLEGPKDIYAVDSDNGLFVEDHTILMDLGKVLEKVLTFEPEFFNNALLKESTCWRDYLIDEDHHRFMRLNDEICLRSQIDCKSVDPITGKSFVFEIKTRSVAPIRYDIFNYKDYLDYQIKTNLGLYESYEREYYDLIRGGFLKYAFQLKIGRMDGAFIAYHNTKEIFGFEYIKTTEIEKRIFGSSEYSDVSFLICAKLITQCLNCIVEALKHEKYKKLKVGFYAESFYRKIIVFVELIPEGQADEKVQFTPDIQDEYDYYTKVKPLTNTIYKYEFFIYTYVNNVFLREPNYNISPGDIFEVKYRFESCGIPSKSDYLTFLHEAYKLDSTSVDMSYVGSWLNKYYQIQI